MGQAISLPLASDIFYCRNHPFQFRMSSLNATLVSFDPDHCVALVNVGNTDLNIPTLFEAVDGRSSLSDDVFMVFGIHSDLDVLHVGLQVFGLLLKGVTDLVSFLRGSINLDQVTIIQERNVGA